MRTSLQKLLSSVNTAKHPNRFSLLIGRFYSRHLFEQMFFFSTEALKQNQRPFLFFTSMFVNVSTNRKYIYFLAQSTGEFLSCARNSSWSSRQIVSSQLNKEKMSLISFIGASVKSNQETIDSNFHISCFVPNMFYMLLFLYLQGFFPH